MKFSMKDCFEFQKWRQNSVQPGGNTGTIQIQTWWREKLEVSVHVSMHVNFTPVVCCIFQDDNIPMPMAHMLWPCGFVRMKPMSAICQLDRCYDPNGAFKGDFQKMSVMAFSSTIAQLEGLYYHSKLFRSIDLDLYGMMNGDHFI